MRWRRRATSAVLLGAVLLGCAVEPARDGGETAAAPSQADVEVGEDGRSLLVDHEGDDHQVVVLAPGDGEIVHVADRPGPRAARTLLVLVRDVRPDGPCFALRYVTVDGDGPGPVHDLPGYLQIADDTGAILDVPPVPVWSPDGSAIAWVEWTAAGTQLRAVGWVDDQTGSHPASEAVIYRLDEVPPGVQLAEWEDGEGETAVLIGWRGDEQWRIAVDPGVGDLA